MANRIPSPLSIKHHSILFLQIFSESFILSKSSVSGLKKSKNWWSSKQKITMERKIISSFRMKDRFDLQITLNLYLKVISRSTASDCTFEILQLTTTFFFDLGIPPRCYSTFAVLFGPLQAFVIKTQLLHHVECFVKTRAVENHRIALSLGRSKKNSWKFNYSQTSYIEFLLTAAAAAAAGLCRPKGAGMQFENEHTRSFLLNPPSPSPFKFIEISSLL